MRNRVAVLAAALLAIAFVGGHLVRSRLGVELSPESIREQVEGMGLQAPALFLALLTFRQFLLFPAIVMLPVGGIAFGAWLGTLLGATGIVLSAMITFAMARGLGGAWMQGIFGARYARVQRRIELAGPPIVGLVTAHPTGPMSAFFWGAGFSSMAVLPFVAAVSIGGSVRALAYAFFGSTLLAPGTTEFWISGVFLVACAVLPLAHPRLRRRLIAALRPDVESAVPAVVAPPSDSLRS